LWGFVRRAEFGNARPRAVDVVDAHYRRRRARGVECGSRGGAVDVRGRQLEAVRRGLAGAPLRAVDVVRPQAEALCSRLTRRARLGIVWSTIVRKPPSPPLPKAIWLAFLSRGARGYGRSEKVGNNG
jgi:hypothetical protein